MASLSSVPAPVATGTASATEAQTRDTAADETVAIQVEETQNEGEKKADVP